MSEPNQTALIASAINKIQQLKEANETLKDERDALKAERDALKAERDALKAERDALKAEQPKEMVDPTVLKQLQELCAVPAVAVAVAAVPVVAPTTTSWGEEENTNFPPLSKTPAPVVAKKSVVVNAAHVAAIKAAAPEAKAPFTSDRACYNILMKGFCRKDNCEYAHSVEEFNKKSMCPFGGNCLNVDKPNRAGIICSLRHSDEVEQKRFEAAEVKASKAPVETQRSNTWCHSILMEKDCMNDGCPFEHENSENVQICYFGQTCDNRPGMKKDGKVPCHYHHDE
jgi:FtsZ-binding cell division protein ZapB